MRVNRILTALVAASLVGSAQTYYSCNSDAQCKYQGCSNCLCGGFRYHYDGRDYYGDDKYFCCRCLGWRIHGSVEDTKLSTNKQHSLVASSPVTLISAVTSFAIWSSNLCLSVPISW